MILKNSSIVIEEFGGPEVLKLKDMQRPKLLPGQLRIQLHSIGVNRADILLRSGNYHTRSLPVTPGFEAAGIVVESRGKVLEGTKVMIFESENGLYRKETIIKEKNIVCLPVNFPLDIAASIPINWMAAYYGIYKLLRLHQGTLLINAAASGVGLAAIQLGKAAGLNVIAAAGNEEKLRVAHALGANILINYTTHDLETEVMRATNGIGVNGAFDIIGGAMFRPMIKSMAPFGKLVSLANVTAEDSVMNVRDFYPKNISIFGFQLGSLLRNGHWNARPALSSIVDDIALGKYQPYIHRQFPLEKAAEAHRELGSRNVIGKILLTNTF